MSQKEELPGSVSALTLGRLQGDSESAFLMLEMHPEIPGGCRDTALASRGEAAGSSSAARQHRQPGLLDKGLGVLRGWGSWRSWRSWGSWQSCDTRSNSRFLGSLPWDTRSSSPFPSRCRALTVPFPAHGSFRGCCSCPPTLGWLSCPGIPALSFPLLLSLSQLNSCGSHPQAPGQGWCSSCLLCMCSC